MQTSGHPHEPAADDFPRPMRRLSAVEAIHVRVPFRRPLLDATDEFTHRRTWLLRVVDEDGREGLGEAALSPIASDASEGSLSALMRSIVLAIASGKLPAAAELAAEGEPGRAALAAIDGALAGLAAAERVGPAAVDPAAPGRGDDSEKAGIPVSALIAFGGPDAGADAASQALELGFETLTLRVGFERSTDQLVDRLRALRAAVGPEPRVRLDVAGAWDLDTATERITAVEPFRIEFVEQPLPAWDLAGHAALRERVSVQIALDESIDSEASARAALAERAADVLVLKPARVGGTGATRRVVEASTAAGSSVVLGTFLETGVGIAAVLRIAAGVRAAAARGRSNGHPAGGSVPELAHGLATAGVLVHDLLAVPLPIVKGRMSVPDSISLDESEVGRYTLERIEAGR